MAVVDDVVPADPLIHRQQIATQELNPTSERPTTTVQVSLACARTALNVAAAAAAAAALLQTDTARRRVSSAM